MKEKDEESVKEGKCSKKKTITKLRKCVKEEIK